MKSFRKHKIHKPISVLTVTIGVMLQIYMIFVEGEPSPIPLLLIVLGPGLYFITRPRT